MANYIKSQTNSPQGKSVDIELEKFFKDISENKSDGSSTLAEKTLNKIIQYIDEFGVERISEVLDYSENIRKDMLIIKNSVRKIKEYVNSEKILKPERIKYFISATIDELKIKKQKLIEIGIKIIQNYNKIAVASFSSIIKGIIDGSKGKIFIALEEDNFAKNLSDKVIVTDSNGIASADIGIMGADAIIKSENKTWIVNGIPSKKVANLLKNKKIFIFAESEKFTSEDFSLSEEIFEKFEAQENFNIICT